MFNKVKNFWLKNKLRIKDIYCDEYRKNEKIVKFLNLLKQEINWKGLIKALRDRIKKLNGSSFSVRERKLLKRKYKEYLNYGKIDYTELVFLFPGKAMKIIKNELKSI